MVGLTELNERSRTIFQRIVETYLDTGVPVGSRTVSRDPSVALSPASVRNVMSDLEEAGLLVSPHTSAGRMPTDLGLRLFVDGLLHMGDLTSAERAEIEGRCQSKGRATEDVLAEATRLLSGLSHCASIVSVPKKSAPLNHIEFVNLGGNRALVVMVFADGNVENRVIDLPVGLPAVALTRAGNYLCRRLKGQTLEELRENVSNELRDHQAELDVLTAKVVETGLATPSGGENEAFSLIVRGRANLLNDQSALENLERIRQLFDDLENKRDLLKLIENACAGEGVRIYIGAENELFSLSGSSVVIAPYRNDMGQIVGALGVIGPMRINYARIIPLVDFTARTVGRIL